VVGDGWGGSSRVLVEVVRDRGGVDEEEEDTPPAMDIFTHEERLSRLL
jgi:hypothetical protein